MENNNKTDPSIELTAEIDPSRLQDDLNQHLNGTGEQREPLNVSNYKERLDKKQIKQLKKKRAGLSYKVASIISIVFYFLSTIISILLIVVIFEGPAIAISIAEDQGVTIKEPEDGDPEIETIVYDAIKECEESSLGGCLKIIETTIVDEIFWSIMGTIFEGEDSIMSSSDPEPDWKGINPLMNEVINETSLGSGENEVVGLEELMEKVNELIDSINQEITDWVSESSNLEIKSDIVFPPGNEGENFDGGTIKAGNYNVLELINEVKELETIGTPDLIADDLPEFPPIESDIYMPLVELATNGIEFNEENIPSPGDKNFSWINFIDKVIDEIIKILNDQLIVMLGGQIDGINNQVIAINEEVQKLVPFNLKIVLPNDSNLEIINDINKIIADVGIIIDDALESANDLTTEFQELADNANEFLTKVDNNADDNEDNNEDNNDKVESVTELINELERQKNEITTNETVVLIDNIYVIGRELLLFGEIGSWFLLLFSIMGIIILIQNKKGMLGNKWVALPFTAVFIIPGIITIFGKMDSLDDVFEKELEELIEQGIEGNNYE